MTVSVLSEKGSRPAHPVSSFTYTLERRLFNGRCSNLRRSEHRRWSNYRIRICIWSISPEGGSTAYAGGQALSGGSTPCRRVAASVTPPGRMLQMQIRMAEKEEPELVELVRALHRRRGMMRICAHLPLLVRFVRCDALRHVFLDVIVEELVVTVVEAMRAEMPSRVGGAVVGVRHNHTAIEV